MIALITFLFISFLPKHAVHESSTLWPEEKKEKIVEYGFFTHYNEHKGYAWKT